MSIIRIKTSDEKEFEVEQKAAFLSKIIKNMFDDMEVSPSESVVPLPTIDSKIYELVIKYSTHHQDDVESVANDEEKIRDSNDMTEWDREFITAFNKDTLAELVIAANYLDINGLYELCCKAIANMLKDKTSDEIREFLNIPNDFTEEEEAEARKKIETLDISPDNESNGKSSNNESTEEPQNCAMCAAADADEDSEDE